ncbi:MAG: hypothetical protein A2W31_06570 [Planctomycetes bacterium RBG_16_64_10]|nr:MAG: hypothetical protein A2W31_06570 [Planctomycetes bacterium RBG_16_64_10]
MDNDGPLVNMRWVPIRPAANTGAFEVVQANNAEIVGGIAVLDTIQPNGNGTVYLINGPEDVAAGKIGRATLALEYPVFAAYDSGDGTPAFGETWGPESGSSVLNKNAAGFFVVYPHTNNRVLVLRTLGSGTPSLGAVYGGNTSIGTSPTKMVTTTLANASTSDLTANSGGLKFGGAGTYMVSGALSLLPSSSSGPDEKLTLSLYNGASPVTGATMTAHAALNNGPSYEVSIPPYPVTVAANDILYLYGNTAANAMPAENAILSAMKWG